MAYFRVAVLEPGKADGQTRRLKGDFGVELIQLVDSGEIGGEGRVAPGFRGFSPAVENYEHNWFVLRHKKMV